MLKELKSFFYLIFIFFFFFLSIKYYFSDEYKKKSYRKFSSLDKDLIFYSNKLKILDNDTKSIIQYIDDNDKKIRLTGLLEFNIWKCNDANWNRNWVLFVKMLMFLYLHLCSSPNSWRRRDVKNFGLDSSGPLFNFGFRLGLVSPIPSFPVFSHPELYPYQDTFMFMFCDILPVWSS